jgi:ABC-2 type transport system permease protein
MSDARTESGSDGDRWPERDVGDRADALLAVAQREVDTLVRTRSYGALALGFALVVIGLPLAGDVAGYVPLVLDLSTTVEILVPVLAFAFGTWSVLADTHSGELEVIRTYPISRATYVLGTYLGRAVGLLAVVLAPLVLLGAAVPFVRDPASSVLVSHATVDSPTYFARFVALTSAYALTTLALAMAVSALARTRRAGVALATLAVLVVVFGFDALVLVGLARGVLGGETLALALGLSPPGAFRGLVLATATGGVISTGPPAANPTASVVGLLWWVVFGLAVATLGAWSPGGR